MTSSFDECVINSKDKERSVLSDQSLSLIAHLKVAVLHLQKAQSICHVVAFELWSFQHQSSGVLINFQHQSSGALINFDFTQLGLMGAESGIHHATTKRLSGSCRPVMSTSLTRPVCAG